MNRPTHYLRTNLFRQWVKRSTKDPLKEIPGRGKVETWCPNCGSEYYTQVHNGHKCLLCETVYQEN